MVQRSFVLDLFLKGLLKVLLQDMVTTYALYTVMIYKDIIIFVIQGCQLGDCSPFTLGLPIMTAYMKTQGCCISVVGVAV